MFDRETISMDELFEATPDSEMLTEAQQRPTVATGRYTFVAKKVQAVRQPTDAKFLAGQPIISVWGQVTDPESGAKRGHVGFDMTWKTVRSEKGYLNMASKLYGLCTKAIGLSAGSNAQEMVDALKGTPIRVYVKQIFQTPEGWKTASTDEAASEYRKAGYRAISKVEDIQPID
jgi:hypothetical protein